MKLNTSGEVVCFAVKRGDLKGRVDVSYNTPSLNKEIPSIFQKRPFGKLGKRFSGGTPKKSEAAFWQGTIPWVSPKDFNGPYINDAEDHISEEAIVETKLHTIPENSLIMVVRSGVLQHSLPVAVTQREITINQDIRALVPNEGVNAEYIAAYMEVHSDRILPRISKHSTTVQSINSPELDSLMIPIPDIKIQESLIKKLSLSREKFERRLNRAKRLIDGFDSFLLDTLDLTAPEKNNRAIYAIKRKDLLQRLDASYYSPYYTTLNRALERGNFKLRTLGDICLSPVGGATPSRNDETLYADNGIKFLRILNIAPNEIKLDSIKFINKDVHEIELMRSQLEADDILMTITGRVGTTAVVTKDLLPANISQHIARLRIKPEIKNKECLPEYLAAFLNSSLGLALSNHVVSGGTRIALDYGAIRSLRIPLPNLETQKLIVAQLQKRLEIASRLRRRAKDHWDTAKLDFEQSLSGEF